MKVISKLIFIVYATLWFVASSYAQTPTIVMPAAKEVGVGVGIRAKLKVFLRNLSAAESIRVKQVDEALQHLGNIGSYHYVEGWNTPGLAVAQATIVLLGIDAEKEQDGDFYEINLELEATVANRGIGRLEVAALALKNKDATVQESSWVIKYGDNNAPATLLTSLGLKAPKMFRLNTNIGGTVSEGLGFEFDGEGLLGRGARINTLAISGKIPLYSQDLFGPNKSRRSTSTDVDLVVLKFESFGYQKGGITDTLGLRSRMTSAAKAGEVVAYHGLFGSSWQSTAAQTGIASFTLATDLEAGYRWGDVEWKNLRATPESTGNFVARLGAVAEIWPRLGPINANIGQGLNFYVRGRFWIDSSKIDDRQVTRGRGFIDSELFMPVGDYRLFLRYEGGMLPPNLGTYTNRVFLGMGAKF